MQMRKRSEMDGEAGSVWVGQGAAGGGVKSGEGQRAEQWMFKAGERFVLIKDDEGDGWMKADS